MMPSRAGVVAVLSLVVGCMQELVCVRPFIDDKIMAWDFLIN